MTNIDQSIYDDLIRDAQQLHDDLREWVEQFSDNEPEHSYCSKALKCSHWIIENLCEAKANNAEPFQARIEAALKRVETGQTTRMDAITLRSALS